MSQYIGAQMLEFTEKGDERPLSDSGRNERYSI